MDEVVTTNCQTVTVTGNLPDSQIRISYFGSCCNSGCTSVDGVETVCIYIIRQTGRTTDTRYYGNIVRSCSQFGHGFVQ